MSYCFRVLDFGAQTKSYLGIGAVQICLVMLFLPFNLMYKSSRLFFLGCFRRLAFAPFVKVDAGMILNLSEVSIEVLKQVYSLQPCLRRYSSIVFISLIDLLWLGGAGYSTGFLPR